MIQMLCVGLGGFLGSVCRFGLSECIVSGTFPLATLLINFLGSFAISVIAEIAAVTQAIPPNLLLFLKTGVCGGFTTFSTFSLETVNLFENGRPVEGTSYALLSVFSCLLGVLAGKWLVRLLLGHSAL